MSFPSSKKPGAGKPGADPAADQKPDVIPGDEIFFNHPSGPLAGKVVCCGEHGATIKVGTVTHKIKWPHILGHKKRQPQGYQIADSGEDGHLVMDAAGKRRFLRVPNEAHEDQLVAKAEPPGSSFSGRPGLSKKVVVEKTGKKNTHWVKTSKDLPKGKNPAKPEAAGAAPGGKQQPAATPHKTGDKVSFTAGEFSGSGTVTGVGKDGAHVKDKTGREHRVHWKEMHPSEPEKPDYPERAPLEPDKAYAKRAVDTQKPVTHLPEEHDKYFHTEGAKTVPIENLHSTKSDEENQEGGENAPKRMLAAYHGKLSKRPPISVAPHPEKPGHYKVLDGNGTYTAAKQLGWKNLPVNVVDEKEHKFKEADAKAKKLAQGIINPKAPEFESHPPKALQPVNTKDELVQMAAQGLEELRDWLNRGMGVASELGFQSMTKPPENVTRAEYDAPGGMLFIAPNKTATAKGLERAEEKVRGYDGNWNRLTDIVRCTLAVDSLDDMADVMKSLKKSGMKIAQVPKNKFLKPTDEGYVDINLVCTMKNGIQAEVQLNVKDMMRAKNDGHPFYDVTRKIVDKYGLDDVPKEKWGVDGWDEGDWDTYKKNYDEQVRIYGEAWAEHVEKHYGSETKMIKSLRRVMLIFGRPTP